MSVHYFAKDGSYGDATDMVVVDTSTWTEDEWDLIDNAPECERSRIAASLTESDSDQLALF